MHTYTVCLIFAWSYLLNFIFEIENSIYYNIAGVDFKVALLTLHVVYQAPFWIYSHCFKNLTFARIFP